MTAEGGETMSVGTLKVYRNHNCAAKHRTYPAMAACVWPRAAWVTGDGPYALLAHCGTLKVTLWPTGAQAQEHRTRIDRAGCGAHCDPAGHEIVELQLPQAAHRGDVSEHR